MSTNYGTPGAEAVSRIRSNIKSRMGVITNQDITMMVQYIGATEDQLEHANRQRDRMEGERIPELEATISRREETIARRQEQVKNDAALLAEANGKVSELDSKLRKATAALERVRAVAESDDESLIRIRLQSALLGAPTTETN